MRLQYRDLGGNDAYDWYDFVLDSFGEGYYVEKTGEVQLGNSVSATGRGAVEVGSSQMRPAMLGRWSVVLAS